MHIARGLVGLAFFVGMAWLLSSHRKRFPTRVVVWGLGLQVALAWLCLGTSWGGASVKALAGFVARLVSMGAPGARLVFGGLADENTREGGWGFAFAFASSGLPVIIFVSALISILYHLGIMQRIIRAIARLLGSLLGVSGAESVAMAANVFVGQTEAPLAVRPFIGSMTTSELNALMTGGFATVAGSVMAVYMGILGPELAPHLLAASVMSAPAAFLIAKVMVPETETPETGPTDPVETERTTENVLEAAANGTAEGLKLWLNVIAMLIAFMGLVALLDWCLASLADNQFWTLAENLSLSRIFGWLFAPVAWLMGIESWADCQRFGSLLGIKIAINDVVAFENLRGILTASETVFDSPRTAKMAAYALCGFANFASIGVQLGALGPLAPNKKPVMARLALRAMTGGAFASWMTATVAGMFLG